LQPGETIGTNSFLHGIEWLLRLVLPIMIELEVSATGIGDLNKTVELDCQVELLCDLLRT
jgi:hypothetical protein